MNQDWHRLHPMPKNPTLEQRIAWHREHAKQCACRPMPASIREAIAKVSVPTAELPEAHK